MVDMVNIPISNMLISSPSPSYLYPYLHRYKREGYEPVTATH